MNGVRATRSSSASLLVSLWALSGLSCAVHTVREAPVSPVEPPDRYPSERARPDVRSAPAEAPWWETLGDPALGGLIQAAFADNLTLAEAAARVRRSRAAADRVGAARLPEVGAQLEGGLEDPGDRSYLAAGVVSWEVDLFSRLGAQSRAAAFDAMAAQHDLAAARVSVSAEVADAYFIGLEQRLQLRLLGEQAELAQALLELTELRFATGTASAVDVLQQRAQLADVSAREPPARATLRASEDRLDVLLGRPADGTDRIAAEHYPTLPALGPVGVPADLLIRRPDLRAQRDRLVAFDHRIGAAIADRLPRITLTGAYGYGSVDGGGGGVFASLLGSLFQPLWDWGGRRAAVEESRAAYEEALAVFTRSYLEALAEVDGILFSEAQRREEIVLVEQQVTALRAAVDEARNRYVNGLSDYLPVLTAVTELQEAERNLLTFRRQLIALRITLHRALGGPLESS